MSVDLDSPGAGAHLSDEELQRLSDLARQCPVEPGALPAAAEHPHLAGCAECRSVLTAYRELACDLAALDRPLAPANFTAQVLARLPQQPLALGREDLVGIGAAVAAALAAAWLLVREGGLAPAYQALRGATAPGRAIFEASYALAHALALPLPILAAASGGALLLSAPLWRRVAPSLRNAV